MSHLEDEFAQQCQLCLKEQPVREYKFQSDRLWRFDFAWPFYAIAFEIEGGIWVRGRHARGAGIKGDCEKYNTAVLMGWKVFRVTADMVQDGSALTLAERALSELTGDVLP